MEDVVPQNISQPAFILKLYHTHITITMNNVETKHLYNEFTNKLIKTINLNKIHPFLTDILANERNECMVEVYDYRTPKIQPVRLVLKTEPSVTYNDNAVLLLEPNLEVFEKCKLIDYNLKKYDFIEFKSKKQANTSIITFINVIKKHKKENSEEIFSGLVKKNKKIKIYRTLEIKAVNRFISLNCIFGEDCMTVVFRSGIHPKTHIMGEMFTYKIRSLKTVDFFFKQVKNNFTTLFNDSTVMVDLIDFEIKEEIKKKYNLSEEEYEETKSTDFKSTDIKGTEFKSTDTRNVEFKNIDFRNAEFKPIEARSTEARSTETKNAELRRASTKTEQQEININLKNENFIHKESIKSTMKNEDFGQKRPIIINQYVSPNLQQKRNIQFSPSGFNPKNDYKQLNYNVHPNAINKPVHTNIQMQTPLIVPQNAPVNMHMIGRIQQEQNFMRQNTPFQSPSINQRPIQRQRISSEDFVNMNNSRAPVMYHQGDRMAYEQQMALNYRRMQGYGTNMPKQYGGFAHPMGMHVNPNTLASPSRMKHVEPKIITPSPIKMRYPESGPPMSPKKGRYADSIKMTSPSRIAPPNFVQKSSFIPEDQVNYFNQKDKEKTKEVGRESGAFNFSNSNVNDKKDKKETREDPNDLFFNFDIANNKFI